MNEIVVHWLFSGGPTPKDAADDLKKLLIASVGVSGTAGENGVIAK